MREKPTGPNYIPFDFQKGVLDPVRKERAGIFFSDPTDDIDGPILKWDLAFTRKESVEAFNLLNQKIHDNFTAINPNASVEPSDDMLASFLKMMEESDVYLEQARAEIEARKALRKKKTEFEKDFGKEQIQDIFSTLATVDPRDTIAHIKSSVESAVMAQVLTGGGVSPALAQAIEDIVDIKATLALWKSNPHLFIQFLMNNGSGLLDAASIALLNAKLLRSPLIPEDVAEQSEKYLAQYQAENDRKMIVVIDDLIEKLEKVSKKGFLPADEAGRRKIQLSLDAVRRHMDDLRNRTRMTMENSESDEKSDEMTERLETLQEKCEKLHMWKSLPSSNNRLAQAGEFISGISLPFGDFAFVGDKLKGAANAVGLKRALYSNAEIAMSLHTYKILRDHKPDVLSSAKAHAEFIVLVEAQHARATRAVGEIAGRFKFKFLGQSSDAQDATLAANMTVLNRQKLAVAEQLATDSTKTFDYDLEQLLDRSLTKGTHQEKSKQKMLETVQLLEQLKTVEASKRKDERLNAQLDEIIQRVKRRYETTFFVDDNKEFVLVDAPEPKGKPFEMVRELLDMTAPEADRAVFIAKIKAHRDGLKDDVSKQAYTDKLAQIERLYRDNPRTTLLRTPADSPVNSFFAWLAEVESVAAETAAVAKDSARAAFSLRQLKKQKSNADSEAEKLDLSLAFDENEKEFQRQAEAWNKQWATMANILSDSLLAREGAPKYLADKRVQVAQQRSQELADRHEKLTAWLAEKNHLKPNAVLDARAAYLADMTPYALGKLVDRLDAVSAASNEDATTTADIKYTREEIAISMFERLRLAQENKPADLVAQAKLLEHFCDSYRLSDTDICAYMAFIEKYGTSALKIKVKTELESIPHILQRLSEPFDNALSAYWEACEAKDEEAILRASEALVAVDRSLLTEKDEEYLEKARSEIKKREALLQAYEEARDQGAKGAKLDERAEAAYFKMMVANPEVKKIFAEDENRNAEHPRKTLEKRKKDFISKVADVMSPIRIVDSGWGKRVETERSEIDAKLANLEKAFASKQRELTEKIAACEKRLANYNNATVLGKFFRSLTFSLSWPPITFGDNDKKRQTDLDAVKLELARAKAEMADEKDKLDAAKKQLEKQTRKVVEHVVKQVRDEIIDQNVSADQIKKVKAFVSTHSPDLSKTLDRNIDFVRTFLEYVASGKSPRSLYAISKLIETGQPTLAESATNLLGLLFKGEFRAQPGTALRPSIMDAIKKLTDAIDPADISSDALYKSALDKYIQPMILSDLDAEVDVNKVKQLLALFDDQEALFSACDEYAFDDASSELKAHVAFSEVQTEEQHRLLNFFAVIPAFAEMNGYERNRDAAFKVYVEKRMQHVLANLDEYNETEVERDFAVLHASRAALLKNEAENPSVAEKILKKTIEALLAKKPQPKWNKSIARLTESYFDADVVNAYRLVRLKELSADKALIADGTRAEALFAEFRSAINSNHAMQGHETLIAELALTKKPSWIVELIVTEFGQSAQLQAMHSNWMVAELKRLGESKVAETASFAESVLPQMMRWSAALSADGNITPTLFSDFVGVNNVDRIQVELEAVMAVVSKTDSAERLDMSSVKTPSDLNALHQHGSDKVAAGIKLGFSPLITALLPAFSIDSAGDYALRLQAQQNLKVFVKEFAGLLLMDPDRLAQSGFVRFIKTNLIMPSADRQAEKEEKRAALRAERPEDAPEVEPLVTGVREYDYAPHPDIYYDYFFLEAQKFCYQATPASVIALFDDVAKLEGLLPEERAAMLTKRFKSHAHKTEVMEPLSNLDSSHVMPIIALFMKEAGSDVPKLMAIQQLKEAMLRLGTGEVIQDAAGKAVDDAAFCKDWCKNHSGENHIALHAVNFFVSACAQADKIRKLSTSVTDFMTKCMLPIELNFAVKGGNPGEIEGELARAIAYAGAQLRSLLAIETDPTVLASLRSMQDRFATIVAGWIKAFESRSAENDPYLRSLLTAVVLAYGTTAQRQQFDGYRYTERLLTNLGDERVSIALQLELAKRAVSAVVVEKTAEAAEPQSPVAGVVVKVDSAIANAMSGYDKELLKQGILARLKDVDVKAYAFNRTIAEIRNSARFAKLLDSETFSKSVSDKVTDIVKQLIIAAGRTETASALEGSGGTAERSRKYLAELLSDETVVLLLDKKLLVTLLLESKKNAELIQVCRPVLFDRANEILSDVGFSEYSTNKVKLTRDAIYHPPGLGMGVMGMGMGVGMQKVRSDAEVVPIRSIADELKKIVDLISPVDRAALASRRIDDVAEKVAHNETERLARKAYVDAMKKVLAPYQLKAKSVAKQGVNPPVSTVAATVFSYDKNAAAKNELIELRKLYAQFAQKKFGFSDTSKIFDSKGQTAEGATNIMLEKVTKRYHEAMSYQGSKQAKLLEDLHNSASYRTLDAADLLPSSVPSMKPAAAKKVSDMDRSPFDLPPPGSRVR